MLADYEVIHRLVGAGVVFNNIGLNSAFLLLEYSTKAISMLLTLFVTKVPLEVPHDCGTALLITGMCLEAPFFKKRRSLLDPESSRTLIVLLLTISL